VIEPWLNFAVALGLGLLVGLERERNKGEGPARHLAGIRSFAIAALGGSLAYFVGGAVLLSALVVGIAAIAAGVNLRQPEGDPGITTELALIGVALLGGLAQTDPGLAAALGAILVALLAVKAPMHRFAKGILTEAEQNDGIALAVAGLVLWPLMPDRQMGPFEALNPHLLWLVVLLVMAIGACGHIATRALGARAGLPLAGLATGFVSSTATIAAMAGRAVRDPPATASAAAGAMLSTVATFLQMMLLLWVVHPPTLLAAAPALAAGAIVAALYGAGFTIVAIRSTSRASETAGRAFSIATALVFGATMAAVLVVAAALQWALGEAGILLGAAIAGLVDAHATAISVASMAAGAKLTAAQAVLPILAALSANAGSKIVVAWVNGSRPFAARVIPGIVLSLAAAWLAAALWPVA
jgi:uncharacterized membrane protein (DUF4010 family)